jgi:UDP-N-acetylmuramate dehydrogenase
MLTRGSPQPPYYDTLASYFGEHQVTNPSVKDVRDAVIAIRSAKLPDPKLVANNGSFFANPFVDQSQFSQLLASYSGIKYWHTDNDRIKISAAWLVEQAGFKDFHDQETGMATWAKQPLVLVNEHANSTSDLLKFKQKIIDAVSAKFGITLEQEPELI